MLTYRHYRNAAHGIIHSMASGIWHDGKAFLAEHLAVAAHRAGAPEVRLDLTAGRVEPPAAASPSLAWYVAEFGRRWTDYVRGVGADPAGVRAVYITAVCDLARLRPAPALGGEEATLTALTATIVDDRGRSHVAAPPLQELYAVGDGPPEAAT